MENADVGENLGTCPVCRQRVKLVRFSGQMVIGPHGRSATVVMATTLMTRQDYVSLSRESCGGYRERPIKEEEEVAQS